MPIPVLKGTTSLSSYQSIDGSNLTIGGLEEKAVSQRGSAGVFFGAGTDFNKDAMLVYELRQKRDYKPEFKNKKHRWSEKFCNSNKVLTIKRQYSAKQ